MRYDVKKFLFVGVKEGNDSFFERAQEAGIIEFIEDEKSLKGELPQDIQKVTGAIKVLRGLPVVEQEEDCDLNESDNIASKVLSVKGKEEKLLEEKRLLNQEIARVSIYGDFSCSDLQFIEKEGNRKIQFYCSKQSISHQLDIPEEMIYVGSDHGLDYFVAVNRESRQYDRMLEIKIEKPVGVLKERLKEVQGELQAIETELKELAKFNDFLHDALVQKYNHYNLTTSKEMKSELIDGSLFAVKGWVPVNRMERLNTLVEELAIHCEEIAVEKEDRVPTFLDNEGLGKIGEDLVHIYDTPSVEDKDPSIWVLGSFAVFFAIILADGGYGLLFLAAALFLMFKFPKAKGFTKRFIKLSTILSVSCITWGVLSNSFFGMSFPYDSPVRNFSLIHWLSEKKAEYHFETRDDTYQYWVEQIPKLQGVGSSSEMLESAVKVEGEKVSYLMLDKFTDNILLELALFVGVVHVSIALLRYLTINWSGIGWLIFMIGGYLYVPSYLEATSFLQFVCGVDREIAAEMGQHLMIGGITLALFLAVIRDKFAGVLELMNLIQVFSDILSYLRLYALGLAGSIVSATVNDMAGSVALAAGLIILIVGHSINILLSLMGGVIHGLRLNFLEWYHYCFDGGGKMFRPLEMINRD